MKTKKGLRRKRILLAITSSVFTLLAIDLSAHIALSHPQMLKPGKFLLILRGLYLNNRNFIHYDLSCSRYDPQLTYTLRPGRCIFANVEFRTEVFVNSRGLRDDEASLEKPEIIVLGDSHSMGWGVNQNETFPKILARKTRVTVLNTGISSYGTAREVESVLRLDLNYAKVLIVQYCPNDFDENRLYVANNYKLTPMAEDVYKATAQDIKPSKYYFPGQYVARTFDVQVLHRLSRMFFGPTRVPDPTGPAPRPDGSDFAADLFLKILKHSGLTSGRKLVLVLEVDAFKTSGGFLPAVEKKAKEGGEVNLRVVNLNNDLRPECYFKLDDHINSLGHRLVAERLYQEICRDRDESIQRMCAASQHSP